MSAESVINLAYAAFLLTFALVVWRVCREPRPKKRNTTTAAQHDVGPDNLRLLQDLDAHLDEYVCEDPDLWDAFGRGGNWDVFNPGLDRLRDAIRDEQQNGDQT